MTARALAKSVMNRAVNRVLRGPRLEKLGSDGGGWFVPVDLMKPDWVCYLAGVGEDITFDLALTERVGCPVYAFDPTPRAIAHVEKTAKDAPGFHFLRYGLWSEETELRFFAPKDPNHVSHSVVNLQGTDDFFLAKVKTITQAMSELGHDRIDLLKLDIEGAEYAVLRSMFDAGVEPRVICVELDPPKPLVEGLRTLSELRARYRLVHVDGKNTTFLRRDQ